MLNVPLLLTSAFAALVIPGIASADLVFNGGFETWSSSLETTELIRRVSRRHLTSYTPKDGSTRRASGFLSLWLDR